MPYPRQFAAKWRTYDDVLVIFCLISFITFKHLNNLKHYYVATTVSSQDVRGQTANQTARPVAKIGRWWWSHTTAKKDSQLCKMVQHAWYLYPTKNCYLALGLLNQWCIEPWSSFGHWTRSPVALRMKAKIEEVDQDLSRKDEEMQSIWAEGVVNGFNQKYGSQTFFLNVFLVSFIHSYYLDFFQHFSKLPPLKAQWIWGTKMTSESSSAKLPACLGPRNEIHTLSQNFGLRAMQALGLESRARRMVSNWDSETLPKWYHVIGRDLSGHWFQRRRRTNRTDADLSVLPRPRRKARPNRRLCQRKRLRSRCHLFLGFSGNGCGCTCSKSLWK